MKEVLISRYEAVDGGIFASKEECMKYEHFLVNCGIFEVTHSSVLTEGRYWLKEKGYIVIAGDVLDDSKADMAEYLCNQAFGPRIGFVKGLVCFETMLPTWSLSRENKIAEATHTEGFLETVGHSLIGVFLSKNAVLVKESLASVLDNRKSDSANIMRTLYNLQYDMEGK